MKFKFSIVLVCSLLFSTFLTSISFGASGRESLIDIKVADKAYSDIYRKSNALYGRVGFTFEKSGFTESRVLTYKSIDKKDLVLANSLDSLAREMLALESFLGGDKGWEDAFSEASKNFTGSAPSDIIFKCELSSCGYNKPVTITLKGNGSKCLNLILDKNGVVNKFITSSRGGKCVVSKPSSIKSKATFKLVKSPNSIERYSLDKSGNEFTSSSSIIDGKVVVESRYSNKRFIYSSAPTPSSFSPEELRAIKKSNQDPDSKWIREPNPDKNFDVRLRFASSLEYSSFTSMESSLYSLLNGESVSKVTHRKIDGSEIYTIYFKRASSYLKFFAKSGVLTKIESNLVKGDDREFYSYKLSPIAGDRNIRFPAGPYLSFSLLLRDEEYARYFAGREAESFSNLLKRELDALLAFRGESSYNFEVFKSVISENNLFSRAYNGGWDLTVNVLRKSYPYCYSISDLEVLLKNESCESLGMQKLDFFDNGFIKSTNASLFDQAVKHAKAGGRDLPNLEDYKAILDPALYTLYNYGIEFEFSVVNPSAFTGSTSKGCFRFDGDFTLSNLIVSCKSLGYELVK